MRYWSNWILFSITLAEQRWISVGKFARISAVSLKWNGGPLTRISTVIIIQKFINLEGGGGGTQGTSLFLSFFCLGGTGGAGFTLIQFLSRTVIPLAPKWTKLNSFDRCKTSLIEESEADLSVCVVTSLDLGIEGRELDILTGGWIWR